VIRKKWYLDPETRTINEEAEGPIIAFVYRPPFGPENYREIDVEIAALPEALALLEKISRDETSMPRMEAMVFLDELAKRKEKP
jgi:hypothetical protein